MRWNVHCQSQDIRAPALLAPKNLLLIPALELHLLLILPIVLVFSPILLAFLFVFFHRFQAPIQYISYLKVRWTRECKFLASTCKLHNYCIAEKESKKREESRHRLRRVHSDYYLSLYARDTYHRTYQSKANLVADRRASRLVAAVPVCYNS